MTRVKRGVAANKRRKNLLKRAKGFDNRRSTNFPLAREALLKADSYAYRDRKNRAQYGLLEPMPLSAKTELHGASLQIS
jgi:large subunit ribosomal protein L20